MSIAQVHPLRSFPGGVAQVLFSRALWYNNSLQFNVYSIPTSNLKSLGQ